MRDGKLRSALRERYALWRHRKRNGTGQPTDVLVREAAVTINTVDDVMSAVFVVLGKTPNHREQQVEYSALFPPADPASVPLLLLVAATNDFLCAGRILVAGCDLADHPTKHRVAEAQIRYGFRMAVLHLYEVRDCLNLVEVREFFESTRSEGGGPADRRRGLARRLNQLADALGAIRNKVAAHYADRDHLPDANAAHAAACADAPRFALLLEASQYDNHLEAGDILQDYMIKADLERLVVPAHEEEAVECDRALSAGTRRLKQKLHDFAGLQVELSKMVMWVIAVRASRLGLLEGSEHLTDTWPEAYQEATPSPAR